MDKLGSSKILLPVERGCACITSLLTAPSRKYLIREGGQGEVSCPEGVRTPVVPEGISCLSPDYLWSGAVGWGSSRRTECAALGGVVVVREINLDRTQSQRQVRCDCYLLQSLIQGE